jgi:serine/threonine protein kinase
VTKQEQGYQQQHHHHHQYPYVVKRLNLSGRRRRQQADEELVQSVVDLAYEAQIISSVRHQNIISVEAISATSPTEGSKYFVVLTRLTQSLEEQLQTWKKRERCRGLLQIVTKQKKNQQKHLRELLLERLRCASDVASAVSYLHEYK